MAEESVRTNTKANDEQDLNPKEQNVTDKEQQNASESGLLTNNGQGAEDNNSKTESKAKLNSDEKTSQHRKHKGWAQTVIMTLLALNVIAILCVAIIAIVRVGWHIAQNF